jgi:DNA-directed RNA polymerase specialized sigma24 family protein
MLVNESISRWRRPSRREVPVPEVYDAVVSGPDVDQQLVLRQALGRLAPRQRAVIVLRYFDDLTEAQTAEALGIGLGTVKSQARDALSRLRSLVPDLADPSLSERAAGAPTPP